MTALPGGGRLLAGLAVAAALLAAGCTETDDQVFEDLGVVRLFLVDPALTRQSLIAPQSRIQVAEWTITRAVITVNGRELDLLGGGTCRVIDTVASLPVFTGGCGSGVVIESSMEAIEVSLELTTSMQLRRARPTPLPATGDEDGDGVPNLDDNCPLLDNPPSDCDDDPATPDQQCDANGDGLGDACALFDPFFLVDLPDSDGDGIADLDDNCIWMANPGQENTEGVAAEGIQDLIGDACTEQIATVNLGGNLTFDLRPDPQTFVQQQGQVTYLTLDFDHTGIDCTDSFQTCGLDRESITFCVNHSVTAANSGCPLVDDPRDPRRPPGERP